MHWFTADLHLSHKNILAATSSWKNKIRPEFSSLHEMNKVLTENIDGVVSEGDHLYILGDIVLGQNKSERLKEWIASLRCKNIYVILGNHDDRSQSLEANNFNLLPNLHFEIIKGKQILMCHYPLAAFPGRMWMLHGHCHGKYNSSYPSCLDVGVDTQYFGHKKYTPYSFEEIVEIIDKRKKLCQP